MQWDLKDSVTPETAAEHAARGVSAAQARRKRGRFDYSGESLARLDQVIEAMRREGATSAQVSETLLDFGCYVGEVLVRSAGARWRLAAETPLVASAGFPIVIEFGGGSFCNPIDKVFRRLDEGKEHDLSYFFRVFVGDKVSVPRSGGLLRRLFGSR